MDISRYVSNTNSNIFAIHNLPEEVIAVLFAYYSRSSEDLRTTLERMLTEDGFVGGDTPELSFTTAKAKAFHEKWVVGYGHSSVAEHAIVHLAIEDVSIIAAKAIEDCRLASYTEKSTRYVKFDPSKYYVPDMSEDLKVQYHHTHSLLLSAYNHLADSVQAKIRDAYPIQDEQPYIGYAAAVRSTSYDLVRGLLPVSMLTSLGVTCNARALARMLSKLLGHELPEVRNIAAKMLEEARKVVPTLLKHVEPYTKSSPRSLAWADYENHSAEISFLNSDLDLGPLEERGKHEAPPREFEQATVRFNVFTDYGAYRDLQRHRLTFISPETFLSAAQRGINGVLLPSRLQELSPEYASFAQTVGMSACKATAGRLVDTPEGVYTIPLACGYHFQWEMNLREAITIIELRSSRQGHSSYRKVAQSMYKEIVQVLPELTSYIRVDMNDYFLSRKV